MIRPPGRTRRYLGRFRPLNPGKYRGDPTNIWFRSSWELKLMRALDGDQGVTGWSSEEFCIPYRSPKDGRTHRYYPDFKVERRDGSTWILEVKPEKQTRPPVPAKTKNRTIREALEFGVNSAKWEAARAYARGRGWKFHIMTERDLGI